MIMPESGVEMMRLQDEVPRLTFIEDEELQPPCLSALLPRKQQHPSAAVVLQQREQHYGPNAALNYQQPLHMVRGRGTYLYDETDNCYLDCVNNVAHVGHCHPQVTNAVCQQLMTLNTNSRYLSAGLTSYCAALAATMPPPLEVTYLVCSGSEANELALRVARACRPGATHVVVLAGAYHGHTDQLISMSSYKFWGPGGAGKPDWVHVIPAPDPYRNAHMDGLAAARAAVAAAHRAGGRVCAFFCESLLSCGGQVVLPPGYLQAVYGEMRAEGALCVADEVQSGFGRVGTSFWGFQTQGVVPDIVTMGKAIGNGFPMGAVVMHRQHAQGFANGMEYFNTCGGCNASAAAGMAVLTTLREERLQEQALQVGQHLMDGLRQLAAEHPFIGDVRGMGLFIGAEIVTDPVTKRHAPVMARWIKESMKARHVLLSTDGPHDNVVKIKPPMVFGLQEADKLLHTLRDMFAEELTAQKLSELHDEEQRHYEAVLQPRLEAYLRNEQSLYASSSKL